MLVRRMRRQPAVYILTNMRNGTLYTGVTSNLIKRVWQHRNDVVAGFSSRYGLKKLVYFEICDDMYLAIAREKQIKAGSRRTKLRLIENRNPHWKDLYDDICS